MRFMTFKRLVALLGPALLLPLVLAACGDADPTPTPVIIEREVIREVEVPGETQIVEVEVPVEVQRRVVILVTPTPGPTSTPRPKKTLIFSDLNWNSAQEQNAIARFIIENGYGYPTDAIFGDTISLWTGLLNGDTNISMEIWLPNQQEVWDKAIKAGEVVPLGGSLADNWQSMFVIPKYVADANPDLKAMSDIPAYKDLFTTVDSKGKAALVTCIPGWQCEQVNAEKLAAYGLGDDIELINPGSGAGLDASIRGAYEKGDNWLGYYWGPTQIAAELDLVVLEEPDYSDACWAADKACAYPTASIFIAIHPDVTGAAPDVVDFLRDWDFSAGAFIAAETYMSENDATFAETAIWYLQNNQDVWTQMVPSDVADKVIAALP